ncbi:hypothetical protein KCP69_00905 [Salmonella enterica subsp. enterica]|nr:hypothetical protein KCP69_00905 [Salmonella enterica subsp. enterica]
MSAVFRLSGGATATRQARRFISAYADIVRERAVVRDMIAVAHEIADAGYDPQGVHSDELLDLAESRVFQIAETGPTKDEGPKSID